MSYQNRIELDWNWFQSEVFIDDSGKIRLPHISVDITKGCNMRCEHCSHLSPLMQGHFPKEELLASLAAWSQKLQPKRLAILGGEPLLHPDFEEIVLAAHQHWRNSQIVVVSNGTLLHRLGDSFLEKIGELERVSFDISQHVELPEWNEMFAQIQTRFAGYKIPITLREAYSQWMVAYQQDSSGRYIPHESSPQRAWNVCTGRSFSKIHKGYLWYCTRLVSVRLAVDERIFGEEWSRFVSHQPMSLHNTQEEIRDYLTQEALPECSMCSDSVEVVVARQMSTTLE